MGTPFLSQHPWCAENLQMGSYNSQLLGPPWIAIETSLDLSPGGGLCQAQGTLGQRGWVTLHQSVMSAHQCRA